MDSLFVRFVLMLWTLGAAVYGYIARDTLAQAVKGEWVPLEGAQDEAMVKVVQVDKVVKSGHLTFSEAEKFCYEQDGHLLSIHNKEELDFIGELVIQVRNRVTYDTAVSIITGRGGGRKWSDGSSSDFFREQVKYEEMKCYYLDSTGMSAGLKNTWTAGDCSNLPQYDDTYIVCRI